MKEKKQIIDSVTELQDGPGAKVGRGHAGGLGAPMTKDVSDILTEQHFLPRSSLVMRLLEIRDDPLAHFLPTKVTPNGTFFCAAPPGLVPELAELFMRPVHNVFKRRGASPDKGPNKRPRLDGSVVGDEDVEQGRRAGSHAPSLGLGSDVIGRGSLGPDGVLDFADHVGGMDDFQMDVPDFEMAGGELDMDNRGRSKSAAATGSRMTTPAADGVALEDWDETYADATCPIAMFDVRPSSQTQGADKEAEAVDIEGKGYSKNTVKALGIIRKDLQPVVGGEDGDKVLSFRKMSDKACLSVSIPCLLN
jgi:cohesin complex subunit SCC1